MHHPVEETVAEVFARVPDRLRRKGIPSVRRAGQKGRPAETDCFLEGPAFDRDGNLYLVDVPFGRIFRVSPAGEFDVAAEYDGEPCGLAIHADGRIFIADQKNGLMVLDPDSGQVSPFLRRHYSENFRGLNDLCFSSDGELYFTDQGLSDLVDPTGRVYRLDPDGRLTCLVPNGPSPNGIAINPSETAVYVAMTRANAVWRLPLMIDGATSRVGLFIQLSGGVGPDGMTFDSSGNLAVAQPGLGTVRLFDREGEQILRIRSSTGIRTTNIAYGGPEWRDLYITESDTGTILRAHMPEPGQRPFSHAGAEKVSATVPA